MRFFSKAKDGGPESKVTGYWLFEIKSFASVVLLRFDEGSREVFHEHAFNAVSWVLKGALLEHLFNNKYKKYYPSFWPIWTPKECLHKVYGLASTTWVLSFRGPWEKSWREIDYKGNETTLLHGRVIQNKDVN